MYMEELLSIKLRPKCLNDVIGQKHLIGEGKILSNLVKNKKIFSMILYGKPGIGKTSIAMAIVNELGCKYRLLNATINNKKDFDMVIEEAKMYHGLVLIMDEIHRLNKDKQDLLLPVLESGLITLIGMTTANPYHSINPAIRSRCQLYELKELTNEDINEAIDKLVKSKILNDLKINKKAKEYIIGLSKNDLRYVYNLIEVAYYASDDKNLTEERLKEICNKPNIFHDKDGDGYYDMLSAMQKSIRGSDVQASLYYLAKLIACDELDSICRRLAVIVYEDIGLANSLMGPKVMAAIDAALMTGLPEARIPLSTIVIELALSPKSNSSEIAIDKAIDAVNNIDAGDIPSYLKSPYTGYLYPHDYKNDYVRQQYLPDRIKNIKFYTPKDNKNENIYKEILQKLEK